MFNTPIFTGALSMKLQNGIVVLSAAQLIAYLGFQFNFKGRVKI